MRAVIGTRLSDVIVPRHGYRACGIGLALLLLVQPAWAQRKEAPPEDLLEVGVVEQLSTSLPLDLPFVDQEGNPVTLGDCFDGQLPVILTLNYSSCPMLCSLQLDGLFDGLKAMQDWDMGSKYRMVTVSIDPSESTERSAMTRQKYLKRYGRPGAGEGYVCLTGKNKEIKQLADAVGFRYRYVPETGEYAHSAVTMICTPDGRMSRYLYGVEYNPQTLRLSLLEASEGKIGSTMDQLLLFCFQYDSTAGKYAPSALKLMKLGAISIVLVVGGVLVVFWRREATRVRGDESEETVQSP
jgi:protein SCO1/2